MMSGKGEIQKHKVYPHFLQDYTLSDKLITDKIIRKYSRVKDLLLSYKKGKKMSLPWAGPVWKRLVGLCSIGKFCLSSVPNGLNMSHWRHAMLFLVVQGINF